MTAYKNYTEKSTKKASKAVTPQTQAIPGREAEMVRNNAGGVVFKTSPMTQLDRFLILGSDKPAYSLGAAKLTADNAKNVITILSSDAGVQAVERIVEISSTGRAPKNDTAIFALSLALTHGTPAVKTAAGAAIPKVARTATDMFTLASYIHDSRGWGRAVRNGFSAWYNDRSPMSLVNQLTKYANRNGWTHKDVLRLAHVRPNTTVRDGLFAFAVGKDKQDSLTEDVREYLRAVEVAKTSTNEKEVVDLITAFNLPREVINTELLKSTKIWAALLPHMGATALIRNLATMTRIGLIGQTGATKSFVIDKLSDSEFITKGLIHPLTALSAQRTYASGRSLRGENTWTPVSGITSALEDTFYLAFKGVVPTGKSRGIFLDTSGSMSAPSPVEGLTCRDVAAVMSMVTVRTEKDTVVRGFSSGSGSWSTRSSGLQDLGIDKNMNLSTVVRAVSASNWGGTDCSLPMVWAKENKISLDSFEIYTDNDTWAGNIQPVQALRDYRKEFNRDARMIVAATLASPFTIADPKDGGMLDLVGFDSAGPQIVANFVRGDF